MSISLFLLCGGKGEFLGWEWEKGGWGWERVILLTDWFSCTTYLTWLDSIIEVERIDGLGH